MFDNVGKNLDEEATKRNVASIGLTAILLGSVGIGVVVMSMFAVAEAVLEPDDMDMDMVEVMLDEPEMEDAPPPPPPPPPPPAAAVEEEEEEEEEPDEPQPDDMQEEVEELKPEVKEEMKSDKKPAGVEGGKEGGVEGGEVGGVDGGVIDGVLGGQLGSGVRKFHHSELEIKKKVMPEYPKAAKDLNLGDQRCRVTVFIDEKGVPYDLSVEACPQAFHGVTREAIMKWRWYPAKDGGSKIKAQFTLGVTYKMR